ncbi:MaoC family dehydratase [Variovorax arabinosiphilus]|uniref:MaoC family dehydratase n=1 Tax=Variovorax arabinosiphilus TaxID=3053498 RepID=UPI0033654D1B
MIDFHRLKAWRFDEIVQRYGNDDTMRYALALGLGSDPTDPGQLQFVNDVPNVPLALPTMAVVLGFPGSWMQDPATGIDFAQIVHGEEQVVWHRPLPAAGAVRTRHRVTRIVDKGPGRGATITYDKALHDADSDALLATVTHTTFARGNGGFATADVPGDAAPPPPVPVPTGEPEAIVDIPTLPQQALLYRLCGDRNPLHSDPPTARAAGFDRPILHGLCTWGIAAHALLAQCAGSDPTRLRSLYARFSAPVFPGETLRLELFRQGNDVRFRVRVPARDKVVLDHGHAVFAA